MENILKVLLFSILFTSTGCFADKLVLSSNVGIEYPAPVMLLHGGHYIQAKYKTWSFSHEHFDSKNFYQKIDLTGLEKEFIRSIFDKKELDKLPDWLALVSKSYSDGLGLEPGSIKKFKIGKLEAYAGHDNKNHGEIYIFDDLMIHQILIAGTKKDMEMILKNIKER